MKMLSDTVDELIWNRLWDLVGEGVNYDLGVDVLGQVFDPVSRQVYYQVWLNLRNQVQTSLTEI